LKFLFLHFNAENKPFIAWNKCTKIIFENYKDLLEAYVRCLNVDHCAATHENNKTIYKHMISSINCASAALPVSKLHPHTKPYWNAAVKETHIAQRFCRTKWLKEGNSTKPTSEAHKSYRDAKSHFKNSADKNCNFHMERRVL